ncbi:hypothetical protein [Sphingobium abikonense]
MNQWAFVIAAYAVTAGATIVMSIISWRAMTSAERAVDRLSDRA